MNESECPICYENITPKTRITTECSHSFCLNCMKKLFSKNNKRKCPVCRSNIFKNILTSSQEKFSNMNIIENPKPNLKKPEFSVDGLLHEKLNDYEITKLMNKSNYTIFLGKAGSGKSSLLTSFLDTKELFNKVYNHIYLFMPPTSRQSFKDSFFDKKLPEEQIFDEVDGTSLEVLQSILSGNATEKHSSLVIFDDVQKSFKDPTNEKLLLNIINNRRHLRTSIWSACQNFKSLSLRQRQGITNIFIFRINKKEMEFILEEILELNKNNYQQIVSLFHKEQETNPHSFLFIDTNTQRLFINWNEIIFSS